MNKAIVAVVVGCGLCSCVRDDPGYPHYNRLEFMMPPVNIEDGASNLPARPSFDIRVALPPDDTLNQYHRGAIPNAFAIASVPGGSRAPVLSEIAVEPSRDTGGFGVIRVTPLSDLVAVTFVVGFVGDASVLRPPIGTPGYPWSEADLEAWDWTDYALFTVGHCPHIAWDSREQTDQLITAFHFGLSEPLDLDSIRAGVTCSYSGEPLAVRFSATFSETDHDCDLRLEPAWPLSPGGRFEVHFDSAVLSTPEGSRIFAGGFYDSEASCAPSDFNYV